MMTQPELYAANSDISKVMVKRHLDKYIDHIKWNDNETILEVGIGDGKLSKVILYPILKNYYKELVLSDISPQMVEYAKKTVILPRVKIVELDICCDRIDAEYQNRFDHIFGFFVLHIVRNPRQAIKNVFEMLKSGGQMFFTCFDHTPVDETFATLHKHPKWGKYGTMESAYNKSSNPAIEYKKDLEDAGFKVDLFENDSGLEFVFDDDQNWIDLFMSVNVILPNIPKEEQEEYKTCYLNTVRNVKSIKYKEIKGKLRPYMNFNMFVIIATKPSEIN